jgi:hypothetical protein
VLFYTGYPRLDTAPNGLPVVLPGRLPSFFRLDLRVEKKWILKKGYWVSFVIEGQNVTLSKEVLGVDCSSGTCKDTTIGPVSIPSIGVEGGL